MLRKLFTGMVLASLFSTHCYSQCFTSTTPIDDCASYGDYISSFTMASVTSSSGCSGNGYSYTSSPVRNLTIGTAYSWSTVVPTYYSDPEGIAIWIDINNNNQFEASERLSTGGPAAINQSGTLTVPTGTTPVNGVRMRVRACYNYVAGPTEGCISYLNTWGETEDYLVNIVGACTNPTVPTLSAGSSTICSGGSGTSLSISTGTLNSATAWQWYSGSCGGTPAGSGTSITVNPTVTTTYYARGEGGCVTPGSCGSITVTVNNPPTITTPPAATTTVCAGNALNLSVTASNAAGYQWYKNSSPIPGATASTYNIPATVPGDAGTYYVVVTGNTACGNVTSTNSVVTINSPVSITAQPTATSNICAGSPLNLSVTASNTTSYQWYKNSTLIPGATASSYSIPATVAGDAGTYYVVIGAQTSCSPATSANAVVNIIQRPTATITVGGASTVCNGIPTNMSVALTGAGPWTFNYYDGTTNTPVTTSSNPYSFSVSPASTTTYSITSLADASCTAIASDYSATATVTVIPRPTATISNNGPSTICSGSNANIDIAFTGTGPWNFTYYNGTTGTPVTGNSSNPYTLTVSPSSTTTYSVTALTDANCTAIGSDISGTATVTVNNPPMIATPPAAVSACSGSGTSLSVGAIGTGLTYQWRLNSTPLTDNAIYSGTQTSTLVISNNMNLGGGAYDVVISGTCPPMVTSTPVMLIEDLNNTWDGSSSTAWSDPDNWSCTTVPIVTTNVLIPNGPTNMPLVNIPNAICNSLSIANAASVGFTGTNNALEVKANISNNNIFNASGGKVILSGSGAQNIPAVTYGSLEISGGSTKTLDGPATVTGILNLVNGYIQLGGYDLTLDVPVQTLGGNASSFIVTNDTGEVIGRNMGVGGNPDAVLFHVGVNSNSYTPIMLENLGTSDHYSVRVMPNVYEDGYGVSPMMVGNPVVDRTWMVGEATAGGSIVNMTPYWNLANQINGFTQTHVYVAHFLNNMWIGYTTTAATAPPAGTFGSLYSAFADSIQSFSPFTVASSGQLPLAIKLNSISAINAGSSNRVNWSTSTEVAGDKFEIQSSADGKIFKTIGAMNSKGTASAYSYQDELPAIGQTYYRLKMLDVNNKFTYSNVVSATVKGTDAPFSVNAYPNPVGGILTVVIDGEAGNNASVVITDITGAVVKQAQAIKGNVADINVSELAQGVYFVKYSDDKHTESIKIHKQ